MEELENDPTASETDLNWLINTYNRLKENNKVASARGKLRTRFPNVANRQDQLRAAGSESDLAKKEALIDAIKKDFPPKNDEERNADGQLYAQVLDRYGEQKNWPFFTPVAAKVSPGQRAKVYNDIA